jgi:3'(2'), 5'-bisphosphate nucleotidase
MSDELIACLSAELPSVVRWAGAVARQLRRHDIALGGKTSGFADTDALTMADLAIQELLVAALRDMGPRVRACRIEAEESSGDLGRFARESPWTIAIDPIDGTRDYRDRTGNAYAVMLHVRTPETIVYTLVYLPEEGAAGAADGAEGAADGAAGTWLEARDGRVVLGPDDPSRVARAVLDGLPPVEPPRSPRSRRVLVAGFLGRDEERARAVATAGLDAVLGAQTAGSLYPLILRGDLVGALVHTPNVYDFPVAMHLARLFGGDAVWVHDGRPVDFRSVWHDERASMLRLPGIVACAVDPQTIATLVDLARDWNPDRYA